MVRQEVDEDQRDPIFLWDGGYGEDMVAEEFVEKTVVALHKSSKRLAILHSENRELALKMDEIGRKIDALIEGQVKTKNPLPDAT